MKQYSFFKKEKNECGGELAVGKRKTRRVLDSNKSMHLVLKSKTSNLFKHKTVILNILNKQKKTKGITIYRSSVQKDHVHLSMRIYSRRLYVEFIRAVTGLIARKLGKGLWKFLPFTRIVAWGRDHQNVGAYIHQNEMEVQGIWQYKPRVRKL